MEEPATVEAPDLVLEISFPPAVLSPNVKSVEGKRGKRAKHWSDVRAATKLYRQEAFVVARNAMQAAGLRDPLPTPVVAYVIYRVPTRGRRDFDNLSRALKPAWDGFQDAGLLVDDSAWVLQPIPQIKLGAAGVTIEFYGSAERTLSLPLRR